MHDLEQSYREAAEAIRSAQALLIAAGAGMGVDSGLPDFRGPEGFWKAYPPFKGRKFSDLSTPHWFHTDSALAWGFFGHRLNLYRAATPHAGFQILRRWGERMPMGYFVFTSNVDGQFKKAGYPAEQILECHGSIHHLQCATPCGNHIWPADTTQIEVDPITIRTTSQTPTCPKCEQIARPNILMFHDRSWVDERSEGQSRRFQSWLEKFDPSEMAVVEIGAGLTVPSVRYETECSGGRLIRINPRDSETPQGGISLPVGALAGLQRLEDLLMDSA